MIFIPRRDEDGPKPGDVPETPPPTGPQPGDVPDTDPAIDPYDDYDPRDDDKDK
jgi:hypothetical protein